MAENDIKAHQVQTVYPDGSSWLEMFTDQTAYSDRQNRREDVSINTDTLLNRAENLVHGQSMKAFRKFDTEGDD